MALSCSRRPASSTTCTRSSPQLFDPDTSPYFSYHFQVRSAVCSPQPCLRVTAVLSRFLLPRGPLCSAGVHASQATLLIASNDDSSQICFRSINCVFSSSTFFTSMSSSTGDTIVSQQGDSRIVMKTEVRAVHSTGCLRRRELKRTRPC